MATVTLFGNVARPEVKDLRGGKQVFEFSLAENQKPRDGQLEQPPVWWRVVCWANAHEVAAQLDKGTRVKVTGAFKCRTYQDRDGNTKVSLEISAKPENIEKQERRELTQSERQHDSAKRNAYAPAEEDPF